MGRIGGAGIGTVDAVTTTAKGELLQFAIDSGTSTTLYLGSATQGSTIGEAVWKIQRFQTLSGVQGDFADSNDNYDNIWNDRELLNYS